MQTHGHIAGALWLHSAAAAGVLRMQGVKEWRSAVVCSNAASAHRGWGTPVTASKTRRIPSRGASG